MDLDVVYYSTNKQYRSSSEPFVSSTTAKHCTSHGKEATTYFSDKFSLIFLSPMGHRVESMLSFIGVYWCIE